MKILEGDGQLRQRRKGAVMAFGNPWEVVLGFERLLSKLEDFKLLSEGYPDPEHFRIGINLAWEKLDLYYQKLDETPIYYVALALHPAYRWDYFEEVWQTKPDWIDAAKAKVLEVWASDYAHLDISRSSSRQDDNEPPIKRSRFKDPFEKPHQAAVTANSTAVIGDEYLVWQRDYGPGDEDVEDPLSYWAARQQRYPRLSRMALDFLTIPPMSAECERVFSAAGKMVIPLRASLDLQAISVCQVLRSWNLAGLVEKMSLDITILQPEDIVTDSNMEGLQGSDSDSEVNGGIEEFESN